jgi:hypothetical protein
MAEIFYDNVRGYKLEVPGGWFKLTPDQRLAMQNGIGPESWSAESRHAIDDGTKLTAAADVHDVDYCLGRTAADRKAADKRFRMNSFRIIKEDAGGWLGMLVMGGIFRAGRRAFFAQVMYRALRISGKDAFDAATKLDIAVRGEENIGAGTGVPM